MGYRIRPTTDHLCTEECNHAAIAQGRFVQAALEGVQTSASPGPQLSGSPVLADFDPARSGKAGAGERRILLKGGTIISMDPKVGDYARGDLLIEGERIAEIGPNINATATVIDATDMIVIPGFCDPHIHCWEGALGRLIPNNASTPAEDTGMPEANPSPTRSYMNALHNVFAPVYRPEDSYIGTLMTLLSAISGGITTVCDNAHNSRSAAHSDASIAAMIDSGVRGVHAYGRPRSGTWDQQFPHDAYRLKRTYFSTDDQLQTMRFYMVGRDTTEEITSVMKIRRDLDLWVTFDSGIGLQPVAELYADGRFDGRETINHGNFVSIEKRRILVANGAKVNVCPRIESQFRFGDIPYQEWVDVGLRPAISNDNPATYAISMFSEMQALYAFQRAKVHRARMRGEANLPAVVTVRDMLEAVTLRGAENCGLDHKIGTLTPGKQADVVMINTGNVHLFPKNNAIGTVVQGADAGMVENVFIAGRLVKWQGRLVGIDFGTIRQMLEQSRDYLLQAVNWPLDTIDFTD